MQVKKKFTKIPWQQVLCHKYRYLRCKYKSTVSGVMSNYYFVFI